MKAIPTIALLTALAAPAVCAAQQSPVGQPKGSVSVEYNSIGTGCGADWYMVPGPKISFDLSTDAGKFSGSYLPLSAKNGNYTGANDFHIMWQAPTPVVSLTGFVMNTAANGPGATVIIGKGNKSKLMIATRLARFSNNVSVKEAKLYSKYLDLNVGLFRDKKGVDRAYGYGTAFFGKHDDSFTVGYSNDDKIWQNASFDRDTWGLLDIGSYQQKTGDWTAELYVGAGDLSHDWFSREIDRLIAFNDIAPKPKSLIPNFPTYLSFAKWVAELRADHTGDTTFVNASAGRNFDIKGYKVGLGGGLEYERRPGEVLYRPSAEFSLVTNVRGFDIDASYGLRMNEGRFHVGATKKF